MPCSEGFEIGDRAFVIGQSDPRDDIEVARLRFCTRRVNCIAFHLHRRALPGLRGTAGNEQPEGGDRHELAQHAAMISRVLR